MRRFAIKSLTTASETIRSSGQALLRGKRLATSHFPVVRSNITGPATMEIAPKKRAAICPSAVTTTKTRPLTSLTVAIRGLHAAAPAYSAKNTDKAAAEPAPTAKLTLLLAAAAILLGCGGSSYSECTNFPAFAKGVDGKSKRYNNAVWS